MHIEPQEKPSKDLFFRTQISHLQTVVGADTVGPDATGTVALGAGATAGAISGDSSSLVKGPETSSASGFYDKVWRSASGHLVIRPYSEILRECVG